MTATPYERLRENATEVASMLVTGIWLAAMFTGQDWWLAALLFGYVVVVPVVSLLFGDEDDIEEWWDEQADDLSIDDDVSDADGEQRDALETLRDRYARGELTDEQFERKVERLLDTETLEDVEDRARARDEQTDSFERSS
jgi:uncharacterized membrane protein